MKRICFSLLALLGVFFLLPATSTAQDMSDKTVVEIASGNNDFTSLVALVKEAGLAETLSGEGPFTVFAPTNAAFDALPGGTKNALVDKKNNMTLGNILKYHVVPGKITSDDLMKMFKGNGDDFDLEPLFGDEFEVEKHDGGIRISDESGQKVNFITTDIMGSNGVIHVIDAVMIPGGDREVKKFVKNTASAVGDGVDAFANFMADAAKGVASTVADVFDDENDYDSNNRNMNNRNMNRGTTVQPRTRNTRNVGNSVVMVASKNNNFSSLNSAIGRAGIADMLNQADGVTVFAPDNDAFNALPSGALNSMSNTELQNVLSFHVLPGKVTSSQLIDAIQSAPRGQYYRLQTINGKSLYAYLQGGSVYLVDGKGNRVKVTQTDVNADNGVIHAVESVLMPY